VNGYVHAHCGPAAPEPYNLASFRPYPPEPVTEYPAPEVTSRDGAPVPVKEPVVSLFAYAEQHGWTCTPPTYAKGHQPHASYGTPSAKAKGSIALRMARGNERAYAVYVEGSTWAWGSLALKRPGFHRTYATLGAFKDAIVRV
jgi:hypothetical protein